MSLLKRARWMLWAFGTFKVAMIGYVRPKLIHIDDERIEVLIKLKRRTRNHVNSMYFGALAVGADIAGGLHAFYHADKRNVQASIVFKSFNAEFHKRAEKHVSFVSKDGKTVEKMLEQSIENKVRVNQNIQVDAYVDYPDKPERIASFVLELSLKVKA